ncbi:MULTISPECIES: hypothetical protein [Asticcacaulis]|uniref:hypothetical protein n=1 Tax=Asticcacaulis TaxID=76890 RepID=UPI001AEA7BA6|nr:MULTISPECIES: hypothetical protein [Asticcacaulis]MBP2160092.1 hypothetical protein [Asticcacaulis solisilvae]MDR6801137.1 hypothetical protein [Asticcacaulis sp. BE141]
MTLPLYPVASDGHAALAQLRQGDGVRFAREKEAEKAANGRVDFVTQSIGPLYDSEDEARKAYASVLDDSRVCVLTCRRKSPPPARRASTEPVLENGVRWPKAPMPVDSVWQLSISYWKPAPVGRTVKGEAPEGQARRLRKTAKGQELTREQILALMDTPMAAARPQKSLDFGLFDFIPPDNPDIVIADE